jgi:AraC-like DNA-binding protein
VAKLIEPKTTIPWTQFPDWTRQRNQPVTYPRMCVDVAVQRGVDRDTLLARAELAPSRLDDPSGQVSLQETVQVFAAAAALTGDNGIGLAVGQRMPLTAHGNLGYLLMCAGTAREAIGLLERFWDLRGRSAALEVKVEGSGLFFELLPEVMLPATVRDLVLGSMLGSMASGMRFILPGLSLMPEIWLQGEPMASAQTLDDSVVLVRYRQARAGIWAADAVRWLDSPLPTANPEALSQALIQCERESVLLAPGDTLLRQVRELLVLDAEGYPTPEQLAEHLHLTSRTLRRRLQERGLGFQSLLEEARRRDSCHLLAASDMEIQRISQLLGFADPANFTRAFKVSMGMTPSQWRERHA